MTFAIKIIKKTIKSTGIPAIWKAVAITMIITELIKIAIKLITKMLATINYKKITARESSTVPLDKDYQLH
jgi:hypothetical protein